MNGFVLDLPRSEGALYIYTTLLLRLSFLGIHRSFFPSIYHIALDIVLDLDLES